MLDADDRRPAPPFEQAALEEIERVRRELEETRKRRRAANDAFDAFLKSFRRTHATPRSDVEPSRPHTGAPALPAVPVSVAGSPTLPPGGPEDEGPAGAAPQGPSPPEAPARGTRTSREAFAGPPPGREPLGVRAAEPPQAGAPRLAPQARRPRVPRGALFAMAAIMLTVMVVFIPRGREAASDGAAVTAPMSVETQEPAAVPAAPPQAVPEAVVPGAELVALRQVWLRVTVDGERVLERELQADARVPLAAGETIVIRAGDGGAVRLSIRGEDQGVLGGDGEVVTRTFSSTPNARLPIPNRAPE